MRTARGIRSRRGFTLMEIMVAVGIVGLFAAAISPQIFGQLEKARRARAFQDMKAIGSALQAYYEDVGQFPRHNVNNQNVGIHLLYSAAGNTPSYSPEPSTGYYPACNVRGESNCWGEYWKNSLKNVLILNTPNVPNFRGPYLRSDEADPWGSHYSVSMFGVTYYANCNATSPYWCRNSAVVISAGPNRIFETDPHMDRSPCGATPWEPKACGDDLIYIVVHRAGATGSL